MKLHHDHGEPGGPIALEAARWVLRHDRGLTAEEQDSFSQWLAADERHRAAWAERRWGWEELDRLGGLQTSTQAIPDPDLLQPTRSRRPAAPQAFTMLACAAAAMLFAIALREPAHEAPRTPADASAALVETPGLALIEQRELRDGTSVDLNRGATLTEHFTAGERRVRLEHGEAHFTVAKDPGRPFVVEAGGVAIRAVGTAFNVRIEPGSVDVVVTEGKVQVAAPRETGSNAAFSRELPVVSAGERTVVSLEPAASAPQVTSLSAAEIEAQLAWQPRMLDFTRATLPEIVAQFNRRNPVRLSLADPRLHGLRLSATFRSDNVEGFVRLMISDFGMRVERRSPDEIVLRRTD